jgi:nucleotide-binding universal stress UspA family protein
VGTLNGFKHILLAFDGSKHSVRALERAEQISEISEARLTVVYVDEPSLDTTVTPGVTGDRDVKMYQAHIGALPTPNERTPNQTEMLHAQENTAEKILSNAKVRLTNVANVSYEVLSGKPAEKINDYAEKEDVDLIVLGNRGISGLKKLVMGSVSKKVLDESNRSVLVVK